MFGLAAGENLGQRRPYHGGNSLIRVNNSLVYFTPEVKTFELWISGSTSFPKEWLKLRDKANTIYLYKQYGSVDSGCLRF